MKLYADRPGRALRQIITDVLVVAWVYLWVRLAMWLYDLIEKLAVPGQKLEGAGNDLSSNLASAGDKVDGVPGVGKSIAAPFDKAAEAAKALADAGRSQQETVHDVALALALITLILPLSLVLFLWLPLRLRWISRASAASTLRSGPAGQDLLALRALASQPLRKLTAIDADVSGAWRRGDPAAVAALAELELRGLGLRGLPAGGTGNR